MLNPKLPILALSHLLSKADHIMSLSSFSLGEKGSTDQAGKKHGVKMLDMLKNVLFSSERDL